MFDSLLINPIPPLKRPPCTYYKESQTNEENKQAKKQVSGPDYFHLMMFRHRASLALSVRKVYPPGPFKSLHFSQFTLHIVIALINV